MTMRDSMITLWDDGRKRFCAVAVPYDQQYKYIDSLPCVTIGFVYEDAHFKGYDCFTFFDKAYDELIESIQTMYQSLNGSVRLRDMGADTDGYIDILFLNGKLCISGQIGATFSGFSLKFNFDADQTFIKALLDCLSIK